MNFRSILGRVVRIMAAVFLPGSMALAVTKTWDGGAATGNWGANYVYRQGKTIGRAVVQTAGEPAKLRVTPDRNHLEASGEDLSYLLVEAVDQDGNLCPLAMKIPSSSN